MIKNDSNHSEKKQRKNVPKLFKPAKEVIKAKNIKYETSARKHVIRCGGIGAAINLINKIKFAETINNKLKIFKEHKPYKESDHILNMAFNILCGGDCLEDIDLLRSDETYLNALNAERIPDQTTAGDFLRRFSEENIEYFQDIINEMTLRMIKNLPKKEREKGIINADATIEGVEGECKEKMDMSYKGLWGFAPLIVSLANLRIPLYIENRSGNTHSSKNAAKYIDKAINLLKDTYKEIYVRGDSAYSITTEFDRWDSENVKFVFSYDNTKKLVDLAIKNINEWNLLKRPAKYEIKTHERNKPKNVKEERIIERKYLNMIQDREEYGEFEYTPCNCSKNYRIIVLKKIINNYKGQKLLFEEIRYFFYITNDRKMTAEEVILFANDRCDHENDIEQLRNGVHALKMPCVEFNANWAYMVIASLAWVIKAWIGIVSPVKNQRKAILRMEFKRFLNEYIFIPAQIICNSGRQLVYRIVGHIRNSNFLKIVKKIQCMRI